MASNFVHESFVGSSGDWYTNCPDEECAIISQITMVFIVRDPDLKLAIVLVERSYVYGKFVSLGWGVFVPE